MLTTGMETKKFFLFGLVNVNYICDPPLNQFHWMEAARLLFFIFFALFVSYQYHAFVGYIKFETPPPPNPSV